MPKSNRSNDGAGAAAALAATFYERSGAAAYGMSADRFAAILDEIVRKYVSPGASLISDAHSSSFPTEQIAGFCAGLRLEELALARACAAGNERAWQDFISRYRQKLHSMALHITRDGAHAADLADSLFADLYGVNARDGVRQSKLLSYTGRGSLEGWLRTVLAQQYVNRYRREYRLVSLDEQAEAGSQFVSPSAPPTVAIDQRLELAIDGALAASSAEERFLLAAYYLDGRTLFEIGELLAVHESTISRRLEKLAKELRKRILANLGQRGMSRRQALEALDVDVRDVRLDIRRRLTQESEMSPFS